MANNRTEAQIVISAKDEASATLGSFQQRLQSIMGPLDSLKSKMAGIGGTGAFGGLSASLDGLKGKLAAVGLISGGLALGGVAALKSGFDSVVDTAQKADRISDLGGRLRLDAEQFQVFEKLSKDAGASIEETGGAFLKFKLNLGQAQSEGGAKLQKLNDSLAKFGLTAEQARQMKPLDLMKAMGQVSSKSGTEADELMKIQLFRELFGKTGATLIPVIEDIGNKYDGVVQKMRDSGTLMTDEMAAMGGKAFKAYEKSQGAMQGLKMAFGIQMMPVFEQFSNVMEARMKANRTAMMPGVKALSDVLSTAIGPFLNDMDAVADKTSGIFKWVSKLAGLVGWDKIVFGGLSLIAAPFVASALAVGAAALGAAGGIGAMLLSAGGSSLAVMGGLISKLGLLQVAFTQVGFGARMAWLMALGPIALVGAAAAGLAYLIYSNWDGIKVFLAGVWGGFTASLAPVAAAFSPIIDLVSSAWTWFKSLFGATSDSAQSFASWASAGKVAGEVIGFAFKAAMLPITMLIDGIKLAGAALTALSSGGFKMPELATAKMFKDDPLLGRAGSALGGSSYSPSINGFNTADIAPRPVTNIPSAAVRADVGGRLDIRIKSDGTAQVDRVESNNRNFEIGASAGLMMGA